MAVSVDLCLSSEFVFAAFEASEEEEEGGGGEDEVGEDKVEEEVDKTVFLSLADATEGSLESWLAPLVEALPSLWAWALEVLVFAVVEVVDDVGGEVEVLVLELVDGLLFREFVAGVVEEEIRFELATGVGFEETGTVGGAGMKGKGNDGGTLFELVWFSGFPVGGKVKPAGNMGGKKGLGNGGIIKLHGMELESLFTGG